VESGGRDNDIHGPPSQGEEDNVVRFPRDWFGPIEDLVPIGSRADEAEVIELGPGAAARDGGAEHGRCAEPGTAGEMESAAGAGGAAEDFWGEAAASVHLAVEPPRRAYQRSTRLGLGRLAAPRVPFGWTRVPAAGFRGMRLPAVVLVGVAIAAVALVITGGRGSGTAHPAGASAQLLPVGAISPLAGPALAERSGRGQSVGSGRQHRGPRTAGAERSTTGRGGRSGKRNELRLMANRGGDNRAAGAGSSGAVVTEAMPSYSTAAYSRPAVASSASTSSAPPSGPVGPGAAFGPGQLQ